MLTCVCLQSWECLACCQLCVEQMSHNLVVGAADAGAAAISRPDRPCGGVPDVRPAGY